MIQRATPILHDFPYRVCVRCGSPIPAHDLVDDEYRPLHRSSCGSDLSADAVGPYPPGADRERIEPARVSHNRLR